MNVSKQSLLSSTAPAAVEIERLLAPTTESEVLYTIPSVGVISVDDLLTITGAGRMSGRWRVSWARERKITLLPAKRTAA